LPGVIRVSESAVRIQSMADRMSRSVIPEHEQTIIRRTRS
jgi:hypothetical protein